jgi:hypothetical protein
LDRALIHGLEVRFNLELKLAGYLGVF